MSTSSVMKLHPEDFFLYVNNDVGELGGRLNNETIRLADHRVLGSVAIRCITLPEDVEERGILVRKIEEGLEIYQKASNGFLVRIYGYVKWLNSLGIVMEHMPAGSLATFTTGASTQLTPKAILRMASDISRGIACMHNLLPNKIITHGNLKPKHILLSGDLRCKVAGFGVDELLTLADPIRKRSKKVASAVINLAYAAPEILKDLNIDITKEQDTYSFGMLLYALITHNNSVTPLFMGNPVLKLREQGDRPTTAPIDKLKQNLDDEDVKVIEDLVKVMQRCWDQNPTKRPDMNEERSKLQVLLHKQNQYHLLREAAETIKGLTVCLPLSSEQEKCLLSAFCTEKNDFVKDSTSKPKESKPDVETQKSKKSPEVSKQKGEQSKGVTLTQQKVSEPVAEVMESKTFTVGSNGREIHIAGCKLIIPEKALRESIELSLTAYYQRESNAEVKRLTPILKCEPHDLTFDKDVEIHLPTCFFTDGVSSVSAVFRRSRDGSHWEELKTIEQKKERFFKLHVQHFSCYDVILKKMGVFFGVFVEKRVECGFLLPDSNFNGALQAKCSIADSIDDQRKEMEGFTKGYADRVLLTPGETYADFELKCDEIAANSGVKRLDNLRISSYREISFVFPSRGEIWDDKDIYLTMKTSEKEISAVVYVPKAVATGSVLINVQHAYGSNIAGGSIIRTVYNQQTMEGNLSPAATELPTTSSSDESLSPRAFVDSIDSTLSGQKPTLSEVFESSDLALPSDVQAAPSFLEIYKVLLKTQKYEEAKTMATKITSMIEGNINATAKEVEEFGIKLREKKLFLESIAFFDAAFAMFEKMGKTEENLKWMERCVWEIKETNKAMIGDDASMKTVVRRYVVPLMREKLRHIEDTSSVSEQIKCLRVCYVLHYIELCEYLVDEWEEREKTLRFALTRMKDGFRSDVMSHRLYGHLLHNLGGVCHHKSRFEEAASFFKQAIDAYKAATDFDDEEVKKRSIENSENNLKAVQQKMK